MTNKKKHYKRLYLVIIFVFIIIISAIALSGLNDVTDPMVKVISYDENGNPYRESYGTLTKMGDDLVIITDYYVAEEVNSVEIMVSDKSRIYANVIKDPRTQTALLIPKTQSFLDKMNPINLGDSNTLIPGETLYMPNEDGSMDKGVMENLIPSFSEYYSPTIITNLKNHVHERGKPVLNYRNEIVGIMTFYKKDRIIIPINTYKKVYYSYYKNEEPPIIKPTGDLVIETGIPINLYLEGEGDGYIGKDMVDIKTIYSKNRNVSFGEIEKIQFGLEDSIYVLDTLYNRIYKFDHNYKLLYTEIKNDNEPPILKNPVSFSVTPAGLVYVLENMTDSSIKLFNRELELIKEVKLSDFTAGYNYNPNNFIPEKLPHFDIEAGDERVYILGRNIILIFDEKLNMLDIIGGNGIGENRFINATDIAILEDDSFAVLDQEGAAVKLFDKNGNYKLDFPIHAPIDNSISTFRGDHIIIMDKSNSKIKLFDNMGHFVRLYQVNSPSAYGVPKGLIFDDSENLHIFYDNQAYIKVYSNNGTLIKNVSSFTGYLNEEVENEINPISNEYYLYQPKLLTVTKNKTIMVDHNNYLHIFDKTDVVSQEQATENQITEEETEEATEEETLGEESPDEETTTEMQPQIKIKSKTFIPPIEYRFNISGIVSGIEENVVYLSESIKGSIYKYDITSGDFREILIKLDYLAYDFIPILAHFDGEYLYIIDKMNDRIIVSTKEGVVKDIETISIVNQPGNLPILDVTTTNTARGKEIIILTKTNQRYNIHNYDSQWRKISSVSPIEINKDFFLGSPVGIDIYNDTLFAIEPFEYHIMSFSLRSQDGRPSFNISNKVGMSYLKEPFDVLVRDGLLYVLDKGNNRVIEYDIMLNQTALNGE
jgi:hypothetical protein